MKKFFGLVLSAVALFGMVSCAGQPGAKGDKGDTGAPGADGKDGVSIVSIELTSSEGLEDTYTITFSDNTTTTFVVTNGSDGTPGAQGEKGEDGITPTVEIGENGNWFINGQDTGIKAEGTDGTQGEPGQDGLTPYIGENDNWWIGDEDTGVKAKGEDGTSTKVEIGDNGNWFIDGVDTGVAAKGQDGKDGADGADGADGQDGLTPYIGDNGNWWIGDKDTGVKAEASSSEVTETFYSVDFDLNGGSFIGEVDLAQYGKVLANSTISLPTPIRERYFFEGWYTGKGINDSKFTNNTLVNGNLTLIAKWIEADNYVYIKERRDQAIEDLSRDFWGRNSIDNITSSLYEQYMNYVSEINFAESIEQVIQITDEYYNWIRELPIDQELVISLRNDLEQYWEYVVSSYPTISETDYPTMYKELLSKFNNDSYTENEFMILQDEFNNFMGDVSYWINEITLDESRVETLRERAINMRNDFEIFFGSVLDFDSENKYFSDENIAYLDDLITQIDNVQNNNQLDVLDNSINSLQDKLLTVKFEDFERDEARKYEFLREIAGNVYTDIENRYNALKEEYNLSEGASPYIENMLFELKEFITNPDVLAYKSLKEIYYNYVELINELGILQNNSQVSVFFRFIPPYDFLGFQSSGVYVLKGNLNTEINIDEIANYYLEEGFVLEGIYKDRSYSEAYEIRFDEETQSYFLNLSEEADFAIGATTTIYPKFKVSDVELAKEATNKWFEEYCVPNLEMGIQQTGLDVADYEESFNSVRTTISNITDETTFETYLKDGINLYLTIAKQVANFQLTANYNNLLENYPELSGDSLFEKYNSKYQEMLNSVETLSTVIEINTLMNDFMKLFSEVLSYAVNIYGDRGVEYIYQAV